MRTNRLCMAAVMLSTVVLVTACDSSSPVTDLDRLTLSTDVLPGGGTADGNRTAEFEEFEVCKDGTTATFDYTVFDRNTSVTSTGQVTLDDGECAIIALIGALGADVSVTEQIPTGYLLDHVDVTTVTTSGSSTQTVLGPTVTGIISGTSGVGLQGVLAEFVNVPAPAVDGRMTGGGSFFDSGRFTHGFELHCDPSHLPNNLEINWTNHAFHLTSLTSAICTDDPALDPLPRPAPFDTYMGMGVGTLNGVPGAVITFTFTDDGEPGTSDLADISIVPPGGGTPITASNLLRFGNHQAHPDN